MYKCPIFKTLQTLSRVVCATLQVPAWYEIPLINLMLSMGAILSKSEQHADSL